MKPTFDLSEVKRLAQKYLDGDNEKIQFTAPSKSIEAVVTVLLCAPNVANKIVATGLLTINENDFHRRVWQWETLFDEYGLENFKGHNWYVKYCIVKDGQDFIEQVSFHPLTKEMRLPDGRILKVTTNQGG